MRTLFGLTLAAAILGLAPQSASAWSNKKFSMGLNYERSAAGNTFWRLWHNGQVPPPPGYGHGPAMPFDGHGYGFGGAMMPVDGHGHNHNSPVPPVVPLTVPPIPVPHAANGYPGQASPFHYSSNSHSDYYYQDPSYYYGHNYSYGYGW